MNNILYVILNKSLNMSPGKAAAQAVHAAMMLDNEDRSNFMSTYRRTVIVLEAKDRVQMDGIADYLSDANIDYQYYIDEGANEVAPFSMTALVVAPFDDVDYQKKEIFEGLRLYGNNDYDYDGCDTVEAEPSMSQLRSENRELRRLWIENEQHLVKMQVQLNEHVRPKWYKRLFKRKKREATEFVS